MALVVALVTAIAGYLAQGRPDLPGAPGVQSIADPSLGASQIADRRQLAAQAVPDVDRWMVIGDAMARHGQYADAVEVLMGSAERHPESAQAWLAIANALAAHAGGRLTPAAQFALTRAKQADPSSPGPDYFRAVAYAREGRVVEAGIMLCRMLASAPADAPWRPLVYSRISSLDRPCTDVQGSIAEAKPCC